MKNKLTRKRFVAWLRGKHPRTKVGQALSGLTQCPLARYTGYQVGTTMYGPKGTHYPLPRWAQQFVRKVDATGQMKRRPWVTARQALVMLGETP